MEEISLFSRYLQIWKDEGVIEVSRGMEWKLNRLLAIGTVNVDDNSDGDGDGDGDGDLWWWFVICNGDLWWWFVMVMMMVICDGVGRIEREML